MCVCVSVCIFFFLHKSLNTVLLIQMYVPILTKGYSKLQHFVKGKIWWYFPHKRTEQSVSVPEGNRSLTHGWSRPTDGVRKLALVFRYNRRATVGGLLKKLIMVLIERYQNIWNTQSAVRGEESGDWCSIILHLRIFLWILLWLLILKTSV